MAPTQGTLSSTTATVTYTTAYVTDDAISAAYPGALLNLEVFAPAGSYPVGGGGYLYDPSTGYLPLLASMPEAAGQNTPPYGWRVTAKAPSASSSYQGQVFVTYVTHD